MSTQTVWGVIQGNGEIISTSGGFTVTHENIGEYVISFSPVFSEIPAITGSQVLYGNPGESTADGIVFPFVNNGAATAFTGNFEGQKQNRNFSFIAMGPVQINTPLK